MRIKRAPLRASGMEGTGCIPKSEAPVVKVSASVKTEKNTHCQSHSVKAQQGRAAGSRKGGPANLMDEETEVAKAKLRHQELMGHIKVEMDEVSGGAPSLGPHARSRCPALHCTSPCVVGLCRHHVGS